MCLHATKPSLLSLDSPNNSETWALKKAQEKSAPSSLGSLIIYAVRQHRAPHTNQRQHRVRAKIVSILMQKATKRRHSIADGYSHLVVGHFKRFGKSTKH